MQEQQEAVDDRGEQAAYRHKSRDRYTSQEQHPAAASYKEPDPNGPAMNAGDAVVDPGDGLRSLG